MTDFYCWLYGHEWETLIVVCSQCGTVNIDDFKEWLDRQFELGLKALSRYCADDEPRASKTEGPTLPDQQNPEP